MTISRYGITRSLLVAPIAAVLLGAAARPASGATLCVGRQAGCFAQIQPAVNVAHDGDTIAIGAGTFAGGITIDKSVRILGAGASRTIIKGGGPVVTIFRATAPDALSVDDRRRHHHRWGQQLAARSGSHLRRGCVDPGLPARPATVQWHRRDGVDLEQRHHR